MNYLGSPVFLFTPDWSEAVSRKVTFDLRPEDIGFGVEYFTPTQLFTVNSWSFMLRNSTAAQIAAVDAFTAALFGRLNGFWLPVPFDAGQVVAGIDTSHFKVAYEALSTFWNDRPDVYLLFTFADGTQAAGQITAVVNNGDGTETVTLSAALAEAPAAGTAINKLHFVRLAEDEESGEFFFEGGQDRKFAVVEIPTEYAAPILGLQPIYLFHFFANAPAQNDWYYTAFAAPVVSNGKLYANWPITFSDLQHVCDGSSDDLKIEAKPDPAMPLALFLPAPFSGTLYVTVSVVDYNSPNAATMLFSGRVVMVEDQGSKLEATCESRLGFLKRKIPRFLKGQNCQNILYDPATCKVGRALFETTVNIVAINNNVFPPTVVCTFAFPVFAAKFQAADYVTNGQIESGLGANYEARSVVASSYNAGSGQLTLTLSLPLYRTQPGAQAQIVAGCDHTAPTCLAKFANYPNFVGFPAIPPRNPTLKAVNANPVSQGGK